MSEKTRRIIFILSLSILAIVLVRTIIINDLIKKTIILLNSSIYRTESYKDYKLNCLIEKNWTEGECKEISKLNKEYPDNGYNQMIWAKSDYDCSDFDNWNLAQNFYQYTYSFNVDWYSLDEDHDRIACEELLKENFKQILRN